MPPTVSDDKILADIEVWLEQAVIGLNLCPFAKAVYVKKQIRFALSAATSVEQLELELVAELQMLASADPDGHDTTLLIHPHVLHDFLDYNDFLAVADASLDALDLVGVLQIASFHPQYQFADTQVDDIDNNTNRSPYPILHLLRESSIERAVAAFPDAADIFDKNIEAVRRLGREGWADLLIRKND